MDKQHACKIELRSFTESDREAVYEILTDNAIKQTYMIPDLSVPDGVEKLFRRLKEYSMTDNHFVRGIYAGKEFLGWINDVDISAGSMELGWVIRSKYHNRGYATAAVNLAIEALFAKGFSEIRAGAFEENIASMRVMEKCGMQRIETVEEIEYRGKTHRCICFAIKKG